MNQKVNPHTLRTGTIKDWKSEWLESKRIDINNDVLIERIKTLRIVGAGTDYLMKIAEIQIEMLASILPSEEIIDQKRTLRLR